MGMTIASTRANEDYMETYFGVNPGDAADSPVVKDAGDEDQFFGGVGVAYEHGGSLGAVSAIVELL